MVKNSSIIMCIIVKENGNIVFEFDKKGFKAFKKAGIIEIHLKDDISNTSFSIKNWDVKRRKGSIIVAIKDEKNNVNKIELNKKMIEKKWKKEDKKIFKKR